MRPAIDRNYRILLGVADSEERAEIGEAFASHGNAVTDCSDGDAVLHSLQAGEFDLIVLDSDLSDTSGVDLMARLQEGSGAKLPVIVIGEARSEACERAFGLGATHYVPRPLMMPLLTHNVWSALRNHARDHEMRWLKDRLGIEPNRTLELAY